MIQPEKWKIVGFALLLGSLLLVSSPLQARRNEILCEVKFTGASGVEKNAGVWIDGLYMGYLKELRGSKKVLLPPGEHDLTFRTDGYKEVNTKIVLGPGQKENLYVWMVPDPQAKYSIDTAEVKLKVLPKRAAVFVDGQYVGHVSEFDGIGQKMLLSPGKHHIRITLPGWQPFETDVMLVPGQQFLLKTELFTGDIRDAETAIKDTDKKPQEAQVVHR